MFYSVCTDRSDIIVCAKYLANVKRDELHNITTTRGIIVT
jgi:hypothetical protein